ncbi:MAG: 5'/3'-nucleotidase SurE [Candidatus Wallbacteria bacterium HGW-Wallbacteria-1]|jgi:5'-nucleotidase|uniref:5'-nucleotidase SurE n=1 Tax=Candidatus Wallbacteria bacterium HGW-Wallbacteria-1 TaxID=2013854 RepID=A0A2N1PS14_9BACT|nr:MAG: 5'/3'-nucleotidase SurE [Candidatus Wallbacteria bacterium HGW-Wallbacteria-1]
MNILVTNDDGIHAPGIKYLAEAMSRLGNVIVVAPMTEQSAVGHAISITAPLRVEEMAFGREIEGFAVSGTPADCVKIGVKSIARNKIDIIVSGINYGYNLGTNILYSGTVAAAREGAILNIPSLAVSTGTGEQVHYETAVIHATRVVVAMCENTLPKKDLLNLNVPNLPPEEIKGLKITRMGISRYEPILEKRMDPRNKVYYWLRGEEISYDDIPESDKLTCDAGYATLSPLTFDLTDIEFIEKLQRWVI